MISGCNSPLDKRTNAIMETLTSKKELEDIKLVRIYENDSVFPCAKDTLVINLIKNLQQSVFNLENTIKEFKSLLPANTDRIWVKTMTPDQTASYKNYEYAYLQASKAMEALLYKRNSNSDENHSIVSIEESKGKTSNDYLGIFYFGDQSDPFKVTKYYLFPMEEATALSSLYTQSAQNGQLPTLYKEGIDVVPVDEDPTKTIEERAEIKKRQKQLEENKKIDSEIIQGLKEFVNNMNKGGSVQIDEMTTFVKSSLNGNTISAYYNLIADKNEYSSYQWQAFGSMMEQSLKEQCQNVLQYFVANGRPKYKVKEAFNRLGVKWKYVYRDYYGRNLFTITITPEDLN